MTDNENEKDTNCYILNREYFSECFDQSANTSISFKTYRQALVLIIMTGVFFVMEIEGYITWFLLCLSIVELLSIRYKRSWWIARQMFSRHSGSKVNISVNDQGIFTDSPHHQLSILWGNITELKSTEKGFVVIHNSGTNYLSRSGLDADVLALLTAKANG